MLEGMQKTHRERILDMLQERNPGYHPLLRLMDIAESASTPTNLQISCHQTIARYVEPECKSVEIKAEVNNKNQVRVQLLDGSGNPMDFNTLSQQLLESEI